MQISTTKKVIRIKERKCKAWQVCKGQLTENTNQDKQQ